MSEFINFLNKKFLEYQNKLGRPATMKEFTAYLGVPVPTYSGWINSKRIPGFEYILLLAEKLGPEVYDILGYKVVSRPTSEERLETISSALSKIKKLGIAFDSPEAVKIISDELSALGSREIFRIE